MKTNRSIFLEKELNINPLLRPWIIASNSILWEATLKPNKLASTLSNKTCILVTCEAALLIQRKPQLIQNFKRAIDRVKATYHIDGGVA